MRRRAMMRLLAAGASVLGIAIATGGIARAQSPADLGPTHPAPLQAFVLASAPDSLADLEAHAQGIGVVYPTFFSCEPASGRIIAEDTAAETATITTYASARKIALMPRFSCQDGQTVHTLLTEPHARARTLAGLAEIAATPAYTGVNIDLENDAVPADRGALTAFVAALDRELHVHGKKLAVDVDGVTHEDPARSTGLYDDRALAAAADYVFVMAWGTHWEGSAPGPIAPLSYVAAVARFLHSLPHAGRFVLGAPMYGLDWPAPTASSLHPRATALQYTDVLALAHSTDATPALDRSVDELTFAYTRAGVTHRVWYMDAQSIADRLRLAHEYGLQAGVWRLGGEDQGLWSSPWV
jgi:spore germination protein YaaH